VGGIETFRDASARIRDLEMAQRVQQHILPHDLPATDRIRFDVRYCPYSEVGGDFYDVTPLDGDRYAVLVADVRGHGVSAALYTMLLRVFVESYRNLAGDPAALMAALNRELEPFMTDDGFATAYHMLLDMNEERVTYVSAGHPPALRFQPGAGTVEQLSASGLLLGISPEYDYESFTTAFKPGDVVLCYSDGATEVTNADGDMLGEDGLAEFLAQEAKRNSKHLPDRLYRHVRDYCHDVSLPDDILLLSAVRS